MEPWPIPFATFQSKAVDAMLGADCPVKKAIFKALKKIHSDEDGRKVFVDNAKANCRVNPKASDILHSLQHGSGDKPWAAAVWYEIHCLAPWKHLAEEIDQVAFKGHTFEEKFPDECEPYLRAAGRWRLVAEARPQAVDEFQWNFDLFDRQPPTGGGDVGAFLAASSELEEVDDKAYGFRVLRVIPRFVGSEVRAEYSRTYDVPQPAEKNASVSLEGSGRFAAFWTIKSNDGKPLRGRFSPDDPVLSITPGPFEFSAEMIGNSKDICDQSGNDQPRDVRDAFVQALYATHIGPRDQKSGSITLFEMRYALRRG